MISIIIPAYNSAATIVEALESVFAQTLWDVKCEALEVRRKTCGEVQYEVIVVDDCSSDNTVEVVRDWIKQYAPSPASHISRLTSHIPLFTLHALPVNGGPAKARNKGIQEAHGDWIAFLDADDVWLPEKLELQMAMVMRHPDVALWAGGMQIIHEGTSGNGEKYVKDRGTRPHGKETEKCVESVPLTLHEMALGNRIGTSTVIVKRSVIETVGGFDEQFRGPEDYDLWLRIVARYRVEKMYATVTIYRERGGSLSMDERKFLPHVLRVLDKAFSEGGVLESHPMLRRKAFAGQYLSAGRMAFDCKSRRRAIRHLIHAWFYYPLVGGRRQLAIWYTFLLGRR